MPREEIIKVFYKLVIDGQIGFTISDDELVYLRFNYCENNKFLDKSMTDEDYLGNESRVDEEYIAETSNGTANYLPLLKIDNKEEFFYYLEEYINAYLSIYNFEKYTEYYGKEATIKAILLNFLSNARYEDFNDPISYIKRSIDFIKDKTLNNYKNKKISTEISNLNNSSIIANLKKDTFGYETPYRMDLSLILGEEKFHLPIINYGISNGICYIYSIQNKEPNEKTMLNKRINRAMYKLNKDIIIEKDYDEKDTILNTPLSFIMTLTIFFKILKDNNINLIRVITFLPDRYFEKLSTDNDYDADKIQSNLTERMILLFIDFNII